MTQQTFKGQSFPEAMRTQLWPLCCGAKILSGFKQTHGMTVDELVKEINTQLDALPDFQVYAGEQINPKLTFLTLNAGQMGSSKIMEAVEKCGFVKIFEVKPRGLAQGFFIRDMSNSYKAA